MCRVVHSIEVLHHSFALCCTEGLLMILSAFCDTDLGLKKHNMGWKSFSNVARKKTPAKLRRTRNKDNDNPVASGRSTARSGEL